MRALVLLLLAGCFTGEPGEAAVFCSSSEDCPGDLSCDVGSHLCVGAGAAALVDASFSAAATNADIIELTVLADTPLSDSAVGVELLTGALAFTLVDTNGTEQRLAASLIDAAPGLYTLHALTLPAAAGPQVRVVVDGPSFVLDRTPPVLFDVTPSTDVIADAAGADAYSACATVNEPPDTAGSQLQVGALVGACVDDEAAAGRVCCSVSVVAGTDDGVVVPVLVVKDLAGNAGEAALPALRVDTAAPGIVDGSVEVNIRIGNLPVDTAFANAVVTVSFVVDEDLFLDPAVVLDDGSPFVVTRNGRSITARRVGGAADGAHGVNVGVVDVFGHAAVVPLGAQITYAVADTSCPAPAGVFSCFDLDGDGSFAPSQSCPTGDDPDDRDVTRHPLAIDLPADGIDQDGDGADDVVSDAFLFVDSEAGDDAGAGTQADPLATIEAADLLCARLCAGVLLADRATAYPFEGANVRVISGGRDPTTWEAGGGRSRVTPSPSSLIGEFDHVDVDGLFFLGAGARLIDSVASEVVCVGGRVERTQIGVFRVQDESDCSVVESTLGRSVVEQESVLLLLRSSAGGVVLENRGALSAVSSLLTSSGGSAPIETPQFNSYDRIALLGSTVVADATAPAAVVGNNGEELLVVDSIAVSSSAGLPLFDLSPSSFGAFYSSLFSPGALVVKRQQGPDELPLDFDDLVACGETACPAGAPFQGPFRALAIDGDDPELGADGSLSATSPVRGSVAVADVFSFAGLPSTILLDRNGQCRFASDGTSTPGALP